jgi:hypothetical protein
MTITQVLDTLKHCYQGGWSKGSEVTSQELIKNQFS